MAQNEMRAKPALPERVRSMEGLDPNRAHFDEATGAVLRDRNGATSMLGIRGDARSKGAGIHLASEWVQVGAVQRFDVVDYGKPVLVFKLPRKEQGSG